MSCYPVATFMEDAGYDPANYPNFAAWRARFEALPGWGVDVRVKSRLPSGSYGATESLTVIFIDGDPVALEEDAQRIARL